MEPAVAVGEMVHGRPGCGSAAVSGDGSYENARCVRQDGARDCIFMDMQLADQAVQDEIAVFGFLDGLARLLGRRG